MSWMAVAEKDFRDAVRSRLLIVLTVLFALFAVALSYYVSELQAAGEITTIVLISSFLGPVSVFIPIVAIAAAYRAIAGERQSGSLKILMSLPNSREDVVAGKFLGRAAVVSVALLVGFAIGLLVTAVLSDAFSALEYIVFVLLSLLFAFVFVAIAVGVSAFTSSTSRAAYGSFGLFVVFQFLWGIIAQTIVYVANGFSFEGIEQGDTLYNLFQFIQIISPTTAYQQGTQWTLRRVADDQEIDQAVAELPFYIQDWFGFVVLLVWIVVPLAIGYLRFESSDL